MIKSEYILTDTSSFEYNEIEENYIPGCVPTSFSESNANTNGSEIVFNISSYNNPIKVYKSCIKLDFEMHTSETDAALLTAAKNVTLINNFFPYLWSQMELKINDTPVESITNCGIADTMIKLV